MQELEGDVDYIGEAGDDEAAGVDMDAVNLFGVPLNEVDDHD